MTTQANPITLAQVLHAREFHYGECKKVVGPRGGVKVTREVWRRNGMTKTWVTRPGEFRVPIKYGLRGYSYIDQFNVGEFHAAADCPLGREG